MVRNITILVVQQRSRNRSSVCGIHIYPPSRLVSLVERDHALEWLPNTLETIPAPLLDRMEILHLSGYSEEEKMQIALRYLLPRQLKHAGLTAEQCLITDVALHKLIASYTREAGVRRLEQVLGRIIRKVAVKFAEGTTDA